MLFPLHVAAESGRICHHGGFLSQVIGLEFGVGIGGRADYVTGRNVRNIYFRAKPLSFGGRFIELIPTKRTQSTHRRDNKQALALAKHRCR